MNSKKLELRSLRIDDEDSFKKAVEEYKNHKHPFEFAFQFDPTADFSEYVSMLENWSYGIDLPEKFVPSSYYVGVVEGVVVGRLSLRYKLNDFLSRIGGHIGYGVIPTHRKRGYATEMLRQGVAICKEMQIQNVLLTCDIGNTGSQKVIERCGGIFDSVTNEPDLDVQKKRFWINTKNQ